MIKESKINNIVKFIALTFLILSSATYSFAQATFNTIAAPNLIEPISIEWLGNMNFGNVAVSSNLAGTVLLAPAGTRKAGGGVKLSTVNGKIEAACVSVNGLGNSTYSITLPTIVTLVNGDNTITASAFTSYPANSGQIEIGGSQTLSVGATLNIGAAKPAGLYTATAFDVTVDYN